MYCDDEDDETHEVRHDTINTYIYIYKVDDKDAMMSTMLKDSTN